MLRPAPLVSPRVSDLGEGQGFKRTTALARVKGTGQALAKVLKLEGVVRVDGALPTEVCDALKAFILEQVEGGLADVASGIARKGERFSDVLLGGLGEVPTRCDVRLPLEGPVVTALGSAFGATTDLSTGVVEGSPKPKSRKFTPSTPLAALVEKTLGADAPLHELSSLVSRPGSHRQTAHSDTPFQKDVPSITCFIALQDIDVAELGPTVFLPRTHTARAHEAFANDRPGTAPAEASGSSASGASRSARDAFLSTTKTVGGFLKKGDAVVFDSRLVHLGDANRSRSGVDRVLLCATFRNPKVAAVGNPASIRPLYAQALALADLGGGGGDLAGACRSLRAREMQLEEARRARLASEDTAAAQG